MRFSVRVWVDNGCTPVAAPSSPARAGPVPGGVARMTVHRPGPPPTVMLTMPQMARSAALTQVCQPRITAAAEPSGKARVTTSRSVTGNVRKVSDVTTPRLPPPPPRSAQNRSWWSSAAAVTVSPSGNTTDADTSASHVSPASRASEPSPPPNVNPATPTVGQLPEGIERPCAASVV